MTNAVSYTTPQDMIRASSDTVNSPRIASTATFALNSAVNRLRVVIANRPSQVSIHLRQLSEIRGPPLVAAMAGIVRTVHQVLDELESQVPPVYEILKSYRQTIQIAKDDQYSKPVSDVIELLGNEASYLWPQTGGKNPDPADPWLIGSAKAWGYTVVTNENPRMLTRIPAACRLPKVSVPCIRGPHFLLETGIVKDVKFETVEPASFFAGDQG